MKRVLPLPLLAVLIALPASAQVEPWMAGDWQAPANGSEPAKAWHIEADGRYRTTLNGRQVDSGTISAKGSTWNLRSDTGQAQSGNFSSIGGNLKMSGNISGSWTRTGSSPVSSGGHAAGSSSSYAAGSASGYGAGSNPAPGARSNPGFPSNVSNSSFPANFNNPGHSGGPGSFSNSANPGFPQNPGGHFIPPSQTYTSTFGHGKRPDLPGYTAPGQPRHSADNSHPYYGLKSNNPDAGRIQIKDVSAEEYEAYRTRPVGDPNPSKHIDANGHYKYTVEEQLKDHPQGVVYRVNGDDIMRMHNARQQNQNPAPQRDTFAENEKFQQMFRGMTGPRPVPRGGYIPVMKDGKARRFFRGF